MLTARSLAREVPAILVTSIAVFLLYTQFARVVGIVSSYILGTCVYRRTLHPLSGVPGPWLASVSSIWYAYHVRNGRVANLATTLHRQYGPVVRLGPNEVCFNSKAAFKAIYSNGSGFEKSDFYLATALTRPTLDWRLQPHFEDSLDLLSERDVKRYRMQRRLIGPVYRPSNVTKYEAAVDLALRHAVAKLRKLDGAEVDLKEWMHMTVVECLGAAVLSWSPGMITNGTDWGTSQHSYMGWRRKSVIGLFPLAVKAELYCRRFGWAFSILWGLRFKPPPNFRTFFTDVAKRTGRRLKAAHRGKPDDDLAADLIRLHQERPEFNQIYLRKMIVTNFGAGHETMASTLTSLMAMLGSHREVQTRLAHEIRQQQQQHTEAGTHDPASYPYLHAVIRESKRLHPVVAMSLPRTVPSSGLHLDGFFFPAGTTVGCSPIALHRNEDICGPNPSAFVPDRWLGSGEAEVERARDMDMYSLAWGGGARSCPGRHLAEMMVWRVCLAVLENFDVDLTAAADGAMPVYFLSMMTGARARFIPINRSV